MSSSSEEEKEDELSDDTEESVPKHAREARAKVNMALVPREDETGQVPVYCSTSTNRVTAPPRALIVNSKTGAIHAVPSKSPTALPSSIKPLLKTPYDSGPVTDMATIVKASKGQRPTAIIFHHTNPKDVWVMFQFYKELTGDADETPVTDALRSGSLDLKDPKNYAMFSLATTVGANIFREAIQTASDSYPEVAMTRHIVESKALYEKTVPYVVIPRMDPDTIKFKRSGVVVVVNGTVGVYTESPPTLTDKIKRPPKWPKDAVNTMSLATYMNLSSLVKEAPNPKLVVFANVDPSGVLAMVNFYERIVDPTICSKEPGCKHTIYSSFKFLNEQSMKRVKNSWMVLARLCKALPFETILRRNCHD